MTRRISTFLIAITLGISSGVLHAQEEGDVAPSITDADSAPESPAMEDSVDAPTIEEAPNTILLEEKGDVLVMPETTREPAMPISLPTHGMKMEDVERRYGSPLSREPAVGKPPISRWNYDGFSVFFEHRTVLHAVQKDRPAEIYRKDELLPASAP